MLDLAVQGTRKSLLQHHSSKASILRRSAFFTVQLSYPYMTTGKTIGEYLLTILHWFPPYSRGALIPGLQRPPGVWRKCLPTPVFLPEKFHGQRSLVGYCLWSRKESDGTEPAHTLPLSRQKTLWRQACNLLASSTMF